MHDNFDDDEKNSLKADDKTKRKEMRDNLVEEKKAFEKRG